VSQVTATMTRTATPITTPREPAQVLNKFYRCFCCGALVEMGRPPRYPWCCPIDCGGCGRLTEPSNNREWTVFEPVVMRYDFIFRRWVFEGYP